MEARAGLDSVQNDASLSFSLNPWERIAAAVNVLTDQPQTPSAQTLEQQKLISHKDWEERWADVTGV